MQRLTGIGVSPGIVSGRAVVLSQRAQVLRYRIAAERLEQELGRLERARLLAREQLTAIGKRLERRRGPELASLFDAQILMLDDPDADPARRRPDPRSSRSTRSGPSSRCSRNSARCSTRWPTRTSASERATSPISSGGSE